MEISNKTLAIAGATIILFGVSMRIQSGQIPAPANAAAPNSGVKPATIQDSDFSILNQYNTVPEQPIATNLGGTPNKYLIDQNQAGAIVPGVTKVQDDSKLTESNSAAQNGAEASIPPAQPTTTTGDNMLDAAQGSLTDEDEAGFQMMWSTMTPAQRQQFNQRLSQGQ